MRYSLFRFITEQLFSGDREERLLPTKTPALVPPVHSRLLKLLLQVRYSSGGKKYATDLDLSLGAALGSWLFLINVNAFRP